MARKKKTLTEKDRLELIFGALKKKLDRLKGSIFCADMLMDMEIPYLWQRLTAGIKGVYSAPEEWHKAFDKLTLSDVHEVMFRNEFIERIDCLYEGLRITMTDCSTWKTTWRRKSRTMTSGSTR